MRLPAERIARALALTALAWLLVRGFLPPRETAERAGGDDLGAALARWSTGSAPARVHASLGSGAAPAHRAWLAALAAAGTSVAWDAPGAQPIAATADAVADPAGGTRVLVAAPRGAVVALEDAWGLLDSVTADAEGARFMVAAAPRQVRVIAGGLVAQSPVPDSLVLGHVLVLGGAGWESKFVAAALEERGWVADIDLALSPRGDVTQGRPSSPAIATHSAVVVLDTSAAAVAPAIVRFVAQGGGLVLASPALASAPLAALAAGTAGESLAGIEPFDTSFGDPRRSLALTTLRPRADAVALEHRGAQVAVAARRVGRGRVALVGYDDTWRWRLAGAGDAPAEHRDWWAGIVSAVALSRAWPLPEAGTGDEAPWAALVERLGSPAAPGSAPPPSRDLEPWLFGLLLAGLLAEWASRRLNGRS